MSQYGPSSSSSSSALSSPTKEKPIDVIYDAYHEAITKYLLDQPRKANRLTHVQSLADRLSVGKELTPDVQAYVEQLYASGKELTADDQALIKQLSFGGKELTADDHAKILQRAQLLATDLIATKTSDKAFAETKRIINIFLDVIRTKTQAPSAVVTPEMVKEQIMSLLGQFTLKSTSRNYAVSLKAKLQKLNHDIAQLEALKPVAAASVPSSSSAAPLPNPIETAKAAKLQLEKDLQGATLAADKPTDIPAEYYDNFVAFAQHVMNVDRILQAITYEIQFPTINDTPTLSQPTPSQEEVASKRWQTVAAGRKARLADVESSGGRFAKISTRVDDWNEKMPIALSSDEMAERDAVLPYDEAESPAERQARIKQVSGLPFRRIQMDQKAVARDKGSKANQHALPVAKQLHEVDDDLRSEFEKLGIKAYPKNKQSMLGALTRTITRGECWEDNFEDPVSPKSPNPPRRTSMETGDEDTAPVPIPFPPRKAHYTGALTPQLTRHLQLGANSGLLVGRKVKPTDTYSEPVTTDEMKALTAKLARVKL